VCPPPAPKGGGGVHTRRAVRGWGVNSSEDARHWIGLLQYNPSTGLMYLWLDPCLAGVGERRGIPGEQTSEQDRQADKRTIN
jgi:hypothetical protein